MKTVEITLGYFKQGDDLRSCIEEEGNNAEAINLLAARLSSVVDHLDGIYARIYDDIEIHADTHYIAITCEDEMAQRLVDDNLARFEDGE